MNSRLKYLVWRKDVFQASFFSSKQIRQVHCTNILLAKQKTSWSRAIHEAENIVGCPSFLSSCWLFNDETDNISLHLRKLIGSNHSLLSTVKNCVMDDKINTQVWRLIVLLLSKAAGRTLDTANLKHSKIIDVLHNQQILAEATEMIHMGHLIHKALVNLHHSTENETDMIFGNKIALLSGDCLLIKSFSELAELQHQEILHLMSTAVRNLAEAEFVGPRDKQNNPLPARPLLNVEFQGLNEDYSEPLQADKALGNAVTEWRVRHILSTGSLLGKSCQGTLKLAGHPVELQEQGYLFGKHVALAWQACLDCEPFMRESSGSFSLVCAPVLFHLQYDPSFYSEIEKGQDDVQDVDYEGLRKAVLEGPGLDFTVKLLHQHSQAALDILSCFPLTDARTALANIIAAIRDA